MYVISMYYGFRAATVTAAAAAAVAADVRPYTVYRIVDDFILR